MHLTKRQILVTQNKYYKVKISDQSSACNFESSCKRPDASAYIYIYIYKTFQIACNDVRPCWFKDCCLEAGEQQTINETNDKEKQRKIN